MSEENMICCSKTTKTGNSKQIVNHVLWLIVQWEQDFLYELDGHITLNALLPETIANILMSV